MVWSFPNIESVTEVTIMSNVNMDRLVSTFCELIKIPSESNNEQEFLSYLEQRFTKNYKAITTRDKFGNLIAKIPAKNSSSKDTIGFACHGDTVKPGIGIKTVIENNIIKSNGETILAADDKAGIAEILEMLATAEKHPPLEVIITRCEELGCLGSINMDYSLVDSKMAFILDMSDIKEIVVGGPTMITMDVHFKGKSSHAAMAPEKGISSIHAAAKAMAQLKLGKLDEETTANIGVIHGGEIRNGIPEHTSLMAECRSLNNEKAEKTADNMVAAFKQGAKEVGAEVTIDRKTLFKAYLLPEDSNVIKIAKNAFTKYGVTAKTSVIRAATDATQFISHGIPAVAIGIGGRGAHSCQEYAIIDEMTTVAKTIKDIVESLA